MSRSSVQASSAGICIAHSCSKPLTKTATVSDLTGVISLSDYPRVKHFDFIERDITDSDELYDALTKIARSPRNAVIRGTPVGRRRLNHAQRLLHARGEIAATIAEVPRHWVALDFDSVGCPPSIDPINEPEWVADHLVGLLPEEFAGATCICQLTSGAGIKPGIRARLWFWLSRPVGTAELKRWLANAPVDPAVFAPAQIIYIAKPIFPKRVVDPVPRRWSLLRGHEDHVEVPVIPERRYARGSGTTLPGTGGRGYNGYRAAIGDHDGGAGFHGPIMSAIGSYFAKHGSGGDAAWLRADLETAIRDADHGKHDDAYIEVRIRDLDGAIRRIQEIQAAREETTQPSEEIGRGADELDAACRPRPMELGAFPEPTLTAEAATAILETEIRGLFDRLEHAFRAENWKAARYAELEEAHRDELDLLADDDAEAFRKKLKAKASRETKKKFGQIDHQVLRRQIAGAAGLGKTKIIAREYRRRPMLWGRHLAIYAETIKNCQELADDINANPLPPGMPHAEVLRGRTYSDEDTAPVCKKHEIVKEAAGKVKSMYKAFCRNDEIKCEHYDTCDFILRRQDKRPKARILPHQSLASPQTADLKPPEPDFVIIDENVASVMAKHIDVPLDMIDDPSIYSGDAAEVEDHTALGRLVVDLIKSGPEVPKRLNATDSERQAQRQRRLGHFEAARQRDDQHIIKRLRRAAVAADGGGTLADILPSDSPDEARHKLSLATGTVGWRVAPLFRQLARDIASGRDESIGVHFIPAGSVTRTGKRTEADALKVHGLHNLSFNLNTPLLLIDADAIPAVNNQIFAPDRKPIPFVEIRCVRQGEFIQVNDFTGSRSELAPDDDSSKEARGMVAYARKRRGEITAFAEKFVTAGERVFVATTKPIRMAITGEAEAAGKKVPANYRDRRGFDISHNGKIKGRNFWAKHTVAVIVGREEIAVQDAEELARAIYAEANLPADQALQLTGTYVRAHRARFPGSGDVVEFWAHPDPRIQALLELKRERATLQNLDRLRLIHCDDRNCRIFILCKLPLPGIKPHRVDTLSNILAGGTDIERAFRDGPISSNAKFMATRHSGIFGNPNAAEHALRRHKGQIIEIAEKLENSQTVIRDILNAKWRFSPSRPIAVKYRALTSNGPKFSTLIWVPRAPGHERVDLQLADFFGVEDMTAIEFNGDNAVAVMAERDQDEASDRIAELTRLSGDPDPTPEEGAAFLDAADKFFEALNRCPDVPGPKWWTQPVDDSKLVSLIPPGRRFHVWHRVDGDWRHVWYFADAGIFTDREFNRIAVPAEVRQEAERAAAEAGQASPEAAA